MTLLYLAATAMANQEQKPLIDLPRICATPISHLSALLGKPNGSHKDDYGEWMAFDVAGCKKVWILPAEKDTVGMVALEVKGYDGNTIETQWQQLFLRTGLSSKGVSAGMIGKTIFEFKNVKINGVTLVGNVREASLPGGAYTVMFCRGEDKDYPNMLVIWGGA